MLNYAESQRAGDSAKKTNRIHGKLINFSLEIYINTRLYKSYFVISFILIFFVFNSGIYSQDTARYFPTRYNDVKLSSLIFPAALIGYGLTTFNNHGIPFSDKQIYDYKQNHFSNFNTHFDDFLQFVPALTAYTLQLDCYHGKNDMKDMTIFYALSNIIGVGSVEALKMITKRQRPDNAGDDSFPSGHTTFAFIGAEMLSQEYGDKSIWFSIGGYTVASTVGVMRILNNKHWLSDVVVSAGIGILSSRISYLFFYKYIKHYPDKDNKLTFNLLPDISNKGVKLAMAYIAF